MDAEALHRGVRPRDRTVRHRPHEHVRRLRLQGHEVPERVVRRLRLGDLTIRLRLRRVDEVRELDAVLDEEHRDVVADQIEVALLRVELRREAAHVADGVRRAPGPDDGREPDEHRGRRALAKESGRAEVVGTLGRLEGAVSAGSSRVHDAFGEPLVVEVGDLLAQVVVLEQGRAALTDGEAVVGVVHAQALRRRQRVHLLCPSRREVPRDGPISRRRGRRGRETSGLATGDGGCGLRCRCLPRRPLRRLAHGPGGRALRRCRLAGLRHGLLRDDLAGGRLRGRRLLRRCLLGGGLSRGCLLCAGLPRGLGGGAGLVLSCHAWPPQGFGSVRTRDRRNKTAGRPKRWTPGDRKGPTWVGKVQRLPWPDPEVTRWKPNA